MSHGARTLVLIRHAHRDTSDRSADNGLSARGRAQAEALLRHYRSRFGAEVRPAILTSPKKRCRETVQAIAEASGSGLRAVPELLEQGDAESDAGFEARVGAFLDAWVAGREPLTLVCSHGDWLPRAVRHATGGRVRFKKGAWAEIEIEEGRPWLTSLLQCP